MFSIFQRLYHELYILLKIIYFSLVFLYCVVIYIYIVSNFLGSESSYSLIFFGISKNLISETNW